MKLLPADIHLCIDDGAALDAALPDGASRPTAVPVVQTSLFTFPTLADLQAGMGAESRNRVYTRGQNPTVEALETKVAELEQGEECKAFASGMAAVSAVFFGLLESGDHVVFFNDVYGPTLQLARELERFGIAHTIVRDPSIAALEAALRPETRLIWLESPGTMRFRRVSLKEVAAFARARGITTAIDNSWATPLLQKPLTHGIDVVMHTATKYLAGHSDVVAGLVVTDRARMDLIFRRAFMLLGGILHPWDAWLVLRGMRTLPTRLREHERAARTVAEWLETHPAVAEVHRAVADVDPGDDADASDTDTLELRGTNGLVSFRLHDGSHRAVSTVVDALRVFRIGVSWGGVESLALSPQRGDDPASLAALDEAGLPRGLIRLSVGLEGADVLIADLEQALGRLG